VTADASALSAPGPDALRRSPLADRAADLEAASGHGVRLMETPHTAMVNLRVRPDSAAAQRIGEVLGGTLPAANTVAPASRGAVLWLGPDEFLVVGRDGDAAAIVAGLAAALGEDRGSVVDVSAARAGVEVGGPHARDVLEKGCSLDLHPRAFPAGRCAQTALARATVLLWHLGESRYEGGYRVLVGTSFAGYLADWLIDASAEFGD
jgi:sarcosine oxidase subunit gamma